MKNKGKILFGFGIVIALLGGSLLLDKKDEPLPQPQAKRPALQLVEDKEPGHPTAKCLPPRGVYLEEILKVKQYSLIAFKIDATQPEPPIDASRLPKGVTLQQGQHTGHDHDQGPTYPNLDVAIMVLDPFEGCKSTLRSMRFEPLPNSWDPKVRLAMKKAYWVTMFKASEESNVTAQSWLDSITHYVGPNMLYLSDDDIKAVTQLGYTVPKWYDLSLPPEKRRELQNNAGQNP